MVGGETVLAELSNAKIAIKTSTKPITTKSADTKTTAKK